MSRRPATRRSLSTAMGSDTNAVGDGHLVTTGRGLREKPRAAKATWKVGDITRGQISETVTLAEGQELTAEIPGATSGVWSVTAQADLTVGAAIDILWVTGRFESDARGSQLAYPVAFLGPASSGSPITVHVLVGSPDTPYTGPVKVNIAAIRFPS